ncbi:MAG TPA: TonB-dependent receptor [Telluria sp.]|jgi:hemoglobin/transferrin/lactoferrin receptor protein
MSVQMQPRLPLKPIVAILAIACCAAAQAQTAGSEQTLGTIQITAQRGNDTNTVVGANRIEVEQAVSLQDLFKQTPEVSIGGGGLPVAQKLYVRGIGERMLAVTIDGAAQPESAYHHAGQVMVEPELLKRVEVEAGTGAATAGPGALAGALRFTTRSAADLLRADERVGAIVKGSYFSASEGKKLGVSVFGRLNDKFGLLVSGTRFDSDDYEAGNGNKVANTAADAESRFVKLDLKHDAHRLALAYEENRDEGLRNKRTNLIVNAINPAQRQRMERSSATANYDFAPAGKLVALHVTAYANENAVQLAPDTAQREKDGTKTRGVNLVNVSRLGDHKLSYGVDYRRDTGFANVAGVALPDEKASVTGVFLQDDVALGEQWALGLGGRYDRYDYTGMDGRQFDSSAASPSASLAFMPNAQFTIRLGHARALRGVGVMEPFLKAFQTNDPALQAEKARNTDLGLQWQDSGWQANATVFNQQIDNYIGYDDARQNLGQVRTKGYSASAGYHAQQWSASVGMSHAKPRLNDQPLSSDEAFLLGNSSGRTWVAQFDQSFPQQNLKMGWTGRATERLEYVPAGAATKPGYTVHDVYAQWLPLGSEELSITLTVSNLADKFYYDQSSFGFHPRWGSVAALPETGRNIRVSLASRF